MKTENTPSEEYYPGIEYQELFNAIADTKGIAIESDMKDIIAIVHRCFPKEQPAPAMSAEDIYSKFISKFDRNPTKEAILECIEYAQQSQPAAGMKWVRASERLPEITKWYIIRNWITGIGAMSIYCDRYVSLKDFCRIQRVDVNEIEWLDESTPSDTFTREQMEAAINVIEEIKKRIRTLYSYAGMPWEDYSGQKCLKMADTFLNSLTQQP